MMISSSSSSQTAGRKGSFRRLSTLFQTITGASSSKTAATPTSTTATPMMTTTMVMATSLFRRASSFCRMKEDNPMDLDQYHCSSTMRLSMMRASSCRSLSMEEVAQAIQQQQQHVDMDMTTTTRKSINATILDPQNAMEISLCNNNDNGMDIDNTTTMNWNSLMRMSLMTTSTTSSIHNISEELTLVDWNNMMEDI